MIARTDCVSAESGKSVRAPEVHEVMERFNQALISLSQTIEEVDDRTNWVRRPDPTPQVERVPVEGATGCPMANQISDWVDRLDEARRRLSVIVQTLEI